MKLSHIFLLGSLAAQGLALVPKTREPEPKTLATGLNPTIISRNLEVPDETLDQRSDIQYDSHLPALPDGWPNITALEEKASSVDNKDLAVRSRGDVAIRDDTNKFKQYLFLGLSAWSIIGAPVTWFSLQSSCRQFSDPGNAVQCVHAAITQILTIAAFTYQASVLRGYAATRLTQNGYYVPFINKRDEWASNMARELSDGLKTEVRHLGTWNNIEANQKRDSGPAMPLEVFGIKNGDHEFHFTYAGRDAEGKDSFKLGLGNGSFQPNSKGRRQYSPDYSDVYFTEGGIDFAIQSVEPATSIEWDWGSPGNAVEVSGIYESVSCYLGAAGTFTNFAFIIKNALSFQIYDSLLGYTLSAGIMAPFSATQGSGIWSMKIEGGVEQNSCAPF